MESIKLDISKATQVLNPGTVEAYAPQVAAAQEALEKGTCLGNDFLGWLHLPTSITDEFITEINNVANTLRAKCDYVVVAGIGGSYLGARAVIEALSNSFAWLLKNNENPTILYAGNNISEDYLYELTEFLNDKRFGVINISKSGTTTETALAFRLLKKQCENQRGKEDAKDVIVAITDAVKGAARTAATREGYKTFVIPDNVGGRFSVLTPVGLLPIAVAGFDIQQLVKGAQDMENAIGVDVPFGQNIAARYAAVRQALYSEGGNNSTEKAKERTKEVYSQLLATLPPTCILWDNGYRKANVLYLKQYSLLRILTRSCYSHTMKKTLMGLISLRVNV